MIIDFIFSLVCMKAAFTGHPLHGGIDGLLPWAVIGSDESRQESVFTKFVCESQQSKQSSVLAWSRRAPHLQSRTL
jgi:hypothetical protein